ncbi:hypothetical protein OCGS_0658 [Oceaniovalibus guishaninsula JLT2003]|uniref:Uncharacterized protein n=1 Tax=Oceaniovalibus guishaninsula JLT2003 TaxID=1231392 RepID=K2HDM3_9RHOB|nr:hypothetical protein [Oceaniovalibus guishaninsula]EKE45568.1 hypothetical protein OCGS_0658 [Oceaniovalibus guishaninsula JLT2003]
MIGGLATAIGAAILAILLARAFWVVRAERGRGRGSVPGRGHHRLRSEYFSGGGGGGQSRDYTVPRDPQEYARLFVPADKDRTR